MNRVGEEQKESGKWIVHFSPILWKLVHGEDWEMGRSIRIERCAYQINLSKRNLSATRMYCRTLIVLLAAARQID